MEKKSLKFSRRATGDLIRGVVPIHSTWKKGDVVGTLVVNYYVPQSLVSKMTTISISI